MQVREARQARGWSQEALANLLNRHLQINVGGQSGIARIERGERPSRLNEVVAIANYLGINLSTFDEVTQKALTPKGMKWARQELARMEGEVEQLQAQMDHARQAAVAAAAHADETAARFHRASAEFQTFRHSILRAERARELADSVEDEMRARMQLGTESTSEAERVDKIWAAHPPESQRGGDDGQR